MAKLSSRQPEAMSKARRATRNVLALLLGFFGGGYLHYYAMLLLQEHTDLRFYSWSDSWQGPFLRFILVGDFAIGVALVAFATVLIVRRGFSAQLLLLLGFGASVMAYLVVGLVICMLRC
jgi:hypothetical protein